MKRVLSCLTCAVVVCFALVPASHADDSLIAAMELEIRIQELSEKVYKQAREKAWEAAEQTTLGQKYLEANEKSIQAGKASLSLLEQRTRVLDELLEYMRVFELNWKKDGRSGSWLTAIIEDPRHQELQEQQDALWEKYREASKKHDTLLDAFIDKSKKLREITKKFTRKLYFPEMEKRLTELEIEITKEVLKKVEQSYQTHTD